MVGLLGRPARADALPSFPWDTIVGHRSRAAAHPDGIIDLSIGSPVDKVPAGVRAALSNASNAPGYPQVIGTAELREAYTGWFERAHGVSVHPDHVLPTIGSKELVASLPEQLGCGAADTVVIPPLAYPTYEVGVRLAGAALVRADVHELLAGAAPAASMIWVNSPSNPTGAVLPAEDLRHLVEWARARGAVVVSDECYLDLGWDVTPQSILDDEVCDGNHTGLLAVHSLSKRSNLAGYRLGFVTGDPELVARLTALRKHVGLIVPAPVQAAGVAALTDDAPVLAQRGRYLERRDVLTAAFERAGFVIEESQAGLYLWCTRAEPAEASMGWLAERGILAAPGTFYGPNGAAHVRVSLTVSDERIAAVPARLAR